MKSISVNSTNSGCLRSADSTCCLLRVYGNVISTPTSIPCNYVWTHTAQLSRVTAGCIGKTDNCESARTFPTSTWCGDSDLWNVTSPYPDYNKIKCF